MTIQELEDIQDEMRPVTNLYQRQVELQCEIAIKLEHLIIEIQAMRGNE